ncbi:MAG: glycine cleavage system protein R [Solirubrobacterales bacterium]
MLGRGDPEGQQTWTAVDAEDGRHLVHEDAFGPKYFPAVVGQFAVMLIVSVPDDTHVDRLRVQLDEAGRGLGLDAVTVCPVSELDRGPDPTHVVTIYGADRPGIVHRAAQLMAEREVNITDLKTRRTASGDGHLYTLMMEVALPGDAGELESALASMAEEAEVEASISELEVEVI